MFTKKLTYNWLDLTLSFPDGATGDATQPRVQISGDMQSVKQVDLYRHDTACSGSPDMTEDYLTLGANANLIFEADTGRVNLTSNGNYNYFTYVFLESDNGYFSKSVCLAPAEYTYFYNDGVPPGLFDLLSLSEQSYHRVFENNINFDLELSASNFELNEVITIHDDSSCANSSMVTKTLDSGDVAEGKINLLLTGEHFQNPVFSDANDRLQEKKIYIKRTDENGNENCFSNESNNEVLTLYIHQTPSLSLQYANTPYSGPTDENNLRFLVGNMPGAISTGTGFTKEVYIYKDPRCELGYGKKYDIYYSVKGHGGTSFPELIDRTGKYRLGVRVKYVGVGDFTSPKFCEWVYKCQ